MARAKELGTLLSREEGKTLPEGTGRSDARGAHPQIFRRRGAAAARADARIDAARRRRRDPSRSRRRLRADHAVEFPDRDPGVEDRPGAGLRQHRGDQAREPRPRRSPHALAQILHRGRRASGRVQPRDRRRRRRPGDRRASGRRRRSRSPDRRRSARASPKARSSARRACSSRWAARTRWSSSTTPTSTAR